MKKLLILVLLAFPVFPLAAQNFRFGAKGGFSYSDINGKHLDDNAHRSKLGWHAGLMVNIQYPGNTWFSIQPELLYSRKGYENHSQSSTVSDQNGTPLYTEQQGGLVHLSYIDLPLMFNFKTSILILEAGPQLSYLVGFSNDAFIKQTFPDGSETTNPTDRFRKTDINKVDAGIAIGLRLQTLNGAGLGIRFNQGFVKLPTHKSGVSGTQPTAPNARNQYFQLFASFLIPE